MFNFGARFSWRVVSSSSLSVFVLLASYSVLGSAVEDVFRVNAISLQSGDVCLQVDPARGARISSLKLGEKELLFPASAAQTNNNNWGSTFWLSPQSLWGWPPVAAHDSEPYTVLSFTERSVKLQSRPGSGAQITKDIVLNHQQSNRIDIRYTLLAEKDFPEVAAWEITRVPLDGLVFYSVSGEFIDVPMGKMDYTLDRENIVWQTFAPGMGLPEGKLMAHGGEGWLAWVSQGLLYIKRYEPMLRQEIAVGEGDIEIYVSDKLPYAELEVQSAAQSLKQGEQLQWQVSWLILPLPEHVAPVSGNPKLLGLVREQLAVFSESGYIVEN